MAPMVRHESNLIVTKHLVDDGQLPMVCVVSGEPTNAMAIFHQGRKRQWWHWLLLGGVARLILATTGNFKVNLPIAKTVWAQLETARRRGMIGSVLTIVAVVSLFLGAVASTGFLLLALAGLPGLYFFVTSEHVRRSLYPEVYAEGVAEYRFENAHPGFVGAVHKKFNR